MQCNNCGASIKPGALRCLKCGTVLQVAQPAQTPQPAQQPLNTQAVPARDVPPPYAAVDSPVPKSKLVAAMLALFLGALGIHNFYLGYKTKGLIQLLLTLLTCGYGAIITVIWSFVEFILILVGSIDQDAFGVPLSE